MRRDGEAYRTLLELEAEKLGVREHVVFRGQFVSADELRKYLQAADVFVTPYLNEAQVTSGALSYAMGAGAAVVSTPYWHAQELLSGGRGHLFPFRDHAALGHTLLKLFDSPTELRRVRRRVPSSRTRWRGRGSETGTSRSLRAALRRAERRAAPAAPRRRWP